MPEPRNGAPEDDFILDDDTSVPSTSLLKTDDLDAVLARRASPRRRVLQAGVIIVPILVVAGMMLHSTLPASPPSSTYVAVPTWTPRPIPITVASNVTFGTITLNGKRLAGPPPQNITLRAGNNVITLTAPPFPMQSCTVHGPLDARGGQAGGESTCQIVTESSESDNPTHIYVMVMLSGDSLPPDLRDSARSLVARTLGVLTTTVPAGDYYATGISNQGLPIARRATAPLTATFAQTLFDPADIASASAANPIPYECASALCAGGYDPSQPVPNGLWLINVQTMLHWYFTSSSGLLVGSLLLPAPGPHALALTYSSATGWQIADMPPFMGVPTMETSDLCQAGIDLLAQALGQRLGYGFNTTASEPDGMRGCSVQVMDQGNSVAGAFIWRFGVLLAVDAKAHALLPNVPIAPPQEAAAAGA